MGVRRPLPDADDEDAPQRRHDLREVFNALRWIVRTGAPWRYLPTNFPPWPAVYQQTQRWLAAGCFEAMVDDLRVMLRWSAGAPTPDGGDLRQRTLQSTPESGHRAGYDGHKRRKGARSTRPSTRWATCWRCASPRPTRRSGRRSRRWPKRCRR